ncbi:MAG: ATP-binding protein [Bacteroidota bacterium]|nr:ATP-binding protein [Bacteroidota bacterium]
MSVTKKLTLSFHGRILDSLGIQMYQSPVAAIAELIANAWDADAEQVKITLPDRVGDATATASVTDDGVGMTFDECQQCYLKVGRNRRLEDHSSQTKGGRPVLGRKGIGKFAAFGIAVKLKIDTVSRINGERTVFELDLEELRGDEFVSTNETEIRVVDYQAPSEERKARHGTTVTLRNLKLKRTPNSKRFAESIAQRFLLAQTAHRFEVMVNRESLSDENELAGIQFDFPREYSKSERPDGLRIEEGFGIERLGSNEIRWRIRFTKDPINSDELRGISVFCGVKLTQTPFFFGLSGGLPGQHGQQYISGVVKADYLDQFAEDLITTERQRINWEHDQAQLLRTWGQERIRDLLRLWKERRSDHRVKQVMDRMSSLGKRLDRLPGHERRVVELALRKIASIETLADSQYKDLAGAILTAWEGGRLQELIIHVADVNAMDEVSLLNLLIETQVLNALHVAEAVKAKLGIIEGLRRRIGEKELETRVRDYIAGNPWLLSPEWETFKKETTLGRLMDEVAPKVGLGKDEARRKRVDLIMSSGDQLLIVEFMRPGLTVDYDHLSRFQYYVDRIGSAIEGETASRFARVSGLIVADVINRRGENRRLLKRMASANMRALSWDGLLRHAEDQWREFMHVLADRSPDDGCLQHIASAGRNG